MGMTLVYPVQWGVAIRGAHGSYRAPARCSALSGFCLHIREIFFRHFAEREEKIQYKRETKAEIHEFSVKTRKKNVYVVNNDPKSYNEIQFSPCELPGGELRAIAQLM